MSIEAIVTDKAPAAVGPYSAATKSGNRIHVSGELPVDPATGEFAGDDIQAQTRQSLTNVKNVRKLPAPPWPTSPRPSFSTPSPISAP